MKELDPMSQISSPSLLPNFPLVFSFNSLKKHLYTLLLHIVILLNGTYPSGWEKEKQRALIIFL